MFSLKPCLIFLAVCTSITVLPEVSGKVGEEKKKEGGGGGGGQDCFRLARGWGGNLLNN